MPAAVAALLIALGCHPLQIETPHGPAASVWVCGPVQPPPAAPEDEGDPA